MRVLALPLLFLLGACSAIAPAKNDATAFENPQTGTIAAGCGPMQGFAGPLEQANEGCTKAWEAQGWVPLSTAVASLPE